jgi:hypothetical protein
MIQNQKIPQNPFQDDDWFCEVVKEDEAIQKLQKQTFQNFSKKYYPTVESLNPFQQNWLAITKLFSTNLAFSSSFIVFILCTIGVSATQQFAPEEYKPSVLLFGKGQYQVKSSSSSSLQPSSSAISSETAPVVESLIVSETPEPKEVLVISSSSASSVSSLQGSSLSSQSQSTTLRSEIRLVPADYVEPKSSSSSSSAPSLSPDKINFRRIDKAQ